MISGLAGAVALTLLHELSKKSISAAPRMDKLGEQALSKVIEASGSEVPPAKTLHDLTLGGDIIGNAGYYSMVGILPGYSIVTGAAIGLAAGIGAVKLPAKMGLNEKYSNATTKTQWLTVLLYLAGGLVAGAVFRAIERRAGINE